MVSGFEMMSPSLPCAWWPVLIVIGVCAGVQRDHSVTVDVLGKRERYEIENEFEFTSDRKRMSVVARHIDSGVYVNDAVFAFWCFRIDRFGAVLWGLLSLPLAYVFLDGCAPAVARCGSRVRMTSYSGCWRRDRA